MERQPGETLYDFIERRERELVAQITALKGQIEPREKELADIRRLKKREIIPTVGIRPRPTLDQAVGTRPNALSEIADFLAPDSMTIKDLILRAMNDQFSDGGTPAQIRRFIADAYGREIDRASLAPQLSRLKDEGVIELVQVEGDKSVWRLAKNVGRIILGGVQIKGRGS